MGKYGHYTNRMEKFFASPNGKRFFNFAYSWGAAIVVLGALFKLTHLPYANLMLSVGMGVEVIMFFISAFDYPSKEYKWEEVFPVLKSEDENGRARLNGDAVAEESRVQSSGGTSVVIVGGGSVNGIGGIAPQGTTISPASETSPLVSVVQAKTAVGIPTEIDLTEEVAQTLSASIRQLGMVTEQLSRMPELSNSTQSYLEQIEGLTENMKRFSDATAALTHVSAALLASYRSVSGEQKDEIDHSHGYLYQMESLNKNLSGLNTIYEIQLKSLSSQINTIDQINAELNRIKEMYDNTSTNYCEESTKMIQLMAALSTVYARMLDAMNMNIGLQNGTMNRSTQPEK